MKIAAIIFLFVVAIIAILLRVHPSFGNRPAQIRYVIAFLSGFAPTVFILNLLSWIILEISC